MNIVLSDILKGLPEVDPTDYRSKNKALFNELNNTCIVIDDDPTGNQTVYDIPLLTEWDKNVLINEFRKQTPVFFILTNSRSLTASKASTIYTEIGKNIVKASEITRRGYTIISRSDSTLRGHFLEETDAIQQSGNLQDAVTMFIPVMFEGGRVTVSDTHYISDKNILTPVSQTPFAQDHSFGYTNAHLAVWISEKTKGKVHISEVHTFSVTTIRTLDVQSLCKKIISLAPNSYCIINALNYNDLDKISHAFLLAQQSGKKILFRTSSSFIPSYIGLASKGLLNSENLLNKNIKNGGLIVVGSYVAKSSAQLNYLLNRIDKNNAIEVDVDQILSAQAASCLESMINKIDKKLASGNDVIIYTSRKLVTGTDKGTTIAIAKTVSKALITLIQGIATRPKYLLAKGGITSHDIATKGLGMKNAKVLGQILPGIPVWEMDSTTKFPKLPYIVFPGNVGDETSLYTITQKLS